MEKRKGGRDQSREAIQEAFELLRFRPTDEMVKLDYLVHRLDLMPDNMTLGDLRPFIYHEERLQRRDIESFTAEVLNLTRKAVDARLLDAALVRTPEADKRSA